MTMLSLPQGPSMWTFIMTRRPGDCEVNDRPQKGLRSAKSGKPSAAQMRGFVKLRAIPITGPLTLSGRLGEVLSGICPETDQIALSLLVCRSQILQ